MVYLSFVQRLYVFWLQYKSFDLPTRFGPFCVIGCQKLRPILHFFFYSRTNLNVNYVKIITTRIFISFTSALQVIIANVILRRWYSI